MTETGPGPVGSLVSLTALAEGPFTTTPDGRPVATTLTVPRERLQPGPVGARFGLVNTRRSAVHEQCSLTADADGWRIRDSPPPPDLERLLSDRMFLAQHVYAVASATLGIFESTLGRRIPWNQTARLRVSMFDPVSYAATGYDRDNHVVRFGHKRDGRGASHVPLALFHDLVAHEVSHAVIDGYRPRWADGQATPQQLALHEALADLVAILSVFATPERVEQQLAAGAADPADNSPTLRQDLLASGLLGVADGLFSRGASAPGGAARRPLSNPVPANWRSESEPHHQGEVVVGAALRALLRVWNTRIGEPGGDVSRHQMARSGSTIGSQFRGMLLRGLSYMPPVDPSWEDLLRGILAADLVMVPSDKHGYRNAVREEFRRIGVTVGPTDSLSGVRGLSRLSYPVHVSAMSSDPEEVYRFIWENPALMRAAALDPDTPVRVDRVRNSVRISPDGFVVSEIGASFSQEVTMTSRDALNRLGLHTKGNVVVVRGGGLLRFDEGGHLRFAALKTVMDPHRQQEHLEGVGARVPEPAAGPGRPRTFHHSRS